MRPLFRSQVSRMKNFQNSGEDGLHWLFVLRCRTRPGLTTFMLFFPSKKVKIITLSVFLKGLFPVSLFISKLSRTVCFSSQFPSHPRRPRNRRNVPENPNVRVAADFGMRQADQEPASDSSTSAPALTRRGVWAGKPRPTYF